LDVCHGLYKFLRACRVSYPPARHCVGFGHAVKDDRSVAEIWVYGDEIFESKAVVNDLLVDIVGEDEAIVRLKNTGKSLEIIPAISRARRIARAIDNKHASARGQRAL